LKYGSVFTGVGGFELGLDEAVTPSIIKALGRSILEADKIIFSGDEK